MARGLVTFCQEYDVFLMDSVEDENGINTMYIFWWHTSMSSTSAIMYVHNQSTRTAAVILVCVYHVFWNDTRNYRP